MPRGKYPYDYLHNPAVKKPIEEIWADLDGFTREIYKDEPFNYPLISFSVLLPPLYYDGKFTKGLFFSNGVDCLYDLFPRLPEFFFSVASSFCGSIPWSDRAEAYLSLYHHPKKEAWFRKTHPEKKDKILIPLHDADYVNEYFMAPRPVPEKDIDVLTVARLEDVKNLPMLAKAIKIYREKYLDHPIRWTLMTWKDFDLNLKGLEFLEIAEIRKIEQVLIYPTEYIEFVTKVDYSKMPDYYSRAKLLLFGSLFEGKGRAIHEALSCNVPVVCFKDFNQYTRGNDTLFPEGAGLYAEEFDAECMADTLRRAFENLGSFSPRKLYLERLGRKAFFNRCVEAFSSYYEDRIPDFRRTSPSQNLWLDLAVQENYQLGLHDFIYERNPLLSGSPGLESIEKTLKVYLSKKDHYDLKQIEAEKTFKVPLRSLSSSPKIFLIANFLNEIQCDRLIELAKGNLTRSLIIDSETGKNVLSTLRTSDSTFLQLYHDNVVTQVETRISQLTRYPIGNGEMMQVACYRKGNEYHPHHDFDGSWDNPADQTVGNEKKRFLTVLMYLNDVEEGGETFFPEINLKIKPKKGQALLFYNYDSDGKPDQKTLHASLPVMKGEKWIATKWIHK